MSTQFGDRAQVLANWYPRFLANGCDYNDVARILVRSERWEDWPGLWGEVAQEYAALARLASHPRTVARHERLASLYAHYGQFMAFGSDTLRDELHVLSVAAARRSLDAIGQPWRRFEISFDGGMLYANLRLPGAGPGPYPCAVLLPGLDSIKEEWASAEDLYLSYGMATFTLEGPGQGEARRHGGWKPDYERAVACALDALLASGEPVDAERLGVVGRSFGGYLSARVAACEPRMRACVVLGGTYDLEPWDALQPIIREDFRVFCALDTDDAARSVARVATLAPVIAGLTMPLLVVHGGADAIFTTPQARRIHDEAAGSKTWLFYAEGNHVCENYASQYRPYVAEWLADALGA
jgi:dienelactone hydrolase